MTKDIETTTKHFRRFAKACIDIQTNYSMSLYMQDKYYNVKTS